MTQITQEEKELIKNKIDSLERSIKNAHDLIKGYETELELFKKLQAMLK